MNENIKLERICYKCGEIYFQIFYTTRKMISNTNKILPHFGCNKEFTTANRHYISITGKQTQKDYCNQNVINNL